MTARRNLAQRALHEALKVRAQAGLKPWDSLCVYDLVQSRGTEVRFVDIPSLEGMYWKKTEPVILLPSERPAGRQRFACGHELAHHLFGHGTRIDQLLANSSTRRYSDSDEYTADCFAAFLLMPKSAVLKGFSIRNIDLNVLRPLDVYRVSCWLGVGYSTLLWHMNASLGLLERACVEKLVKTTPKTIRTEVLGKSVSGDLVMVDEEWTGRAIDLQVGDFLLPSVALIAEGKNVEYCPGITCGQLLVGVSPGISRLRSKASDWCAYVRVSRRNYVGRSIFRHLEESDND
jgi:hypothetical protein